MYTDSHCHLDFACFDADRQKVIENCHSKGVQRILIPGVEPEQWRKLVTLCEQNTDFFFSVGLHPWRIESCDTRCLESVEVELRQHAKHKACIAIGECGLDATIATPLECQLNILEWHLQLAKELNIPLIIHCVKHHNELLRILRKHEPIRGIIHAFSGSYELAQQYWQRGFYLGVGGTITYERAQKTRKTFSRLPLDALLLETDAPDMPLAGCQGQRNSPESLPQIAKTLADLRGCPLEQVAQASSNNFNALFHL